MSLTPAASVDAFLETPQVICAITYTPLDVQSIIASVQDGRAGATAVFIGTTRNSFKGKSVTRLEYQAYSSLAIKTMSTIAYNAINAASRSEHHPPALTPTPAPQTQTQVQIPSDAKANGGAQSIIKCAVHHRLGTVPIGEPSIVIAVSSPHRKEAFVACEEILEEVKRKAQIWKREYYEGEDEAEAEWKANA